MLRGNDSSGGLDIIPSSESNRFPTWQPGEVIDGNLEVRDLIGEGGMGVVWRVHHREWNRDLAVKMPLPALVESPTARERFLREAETWIDLGVHPHIVQCWFVKDISGLPSLFLDYLTGGSLKQWLDEGHVGPGQWERILEIGIQIAEGLAYSHSRGVVHRDVKPANLLIRGDERVCITDFGIVKTASNPEPVESLPKFNPANLVDLSLTRTGAFLGTPQYGAPEQWGSASEVDHRADIYAVGVTLYEMCCGRRPFDHDDEELAPEVLIERHLAAAVLDPREYCTEVPETLAKLVIACLEKDPIQRPQSMEELKAKLGEIYTQVTRKRYREVGRVPSIQRPDILNNRAVSLLSLGKRHDARKVWLKGLRIESGHPECLYNLTQLDLRRGVIDSDEALPRLRQAKADLPLAMLCIQESQPEEALRILMSLPIDEHPSPGILQRVLGDALMYTGQFYGAEQAYQSALKLMPSDHSSHERKRLASVGKRYLKGKFLFPSATSTFKQNLNEPGCKAIISNNSRRVYSLSPREITAWDLEKECVEHRVPRDEDSLEIHRVWISTDFLLLEDDSGFELWKLPELTLIGRDPGEVLDVTPDLTHLAARELEGNILFDLKSAKRMPLKHKEVPLLGDRVVGCFAPNSDQLCLVLANGRVALTNEEGLIVQEAWPSTLDDAFGVSCLKVDHGGTILYVGYHDGRLKAFDFAEQKQIHDLDLSRTLVGLSISEVSESLVVHHPDGFTVLDSSGRTLMTGENPVVVDEKNGRLLHFEDGYLCLTGLRPFRRIRRWAEKVEPQISLSLAKDGGRAVSVDCQGCLQVWEVDEDNRVWEKAFLLSPGRSYAEIVTASTRFQESMTKAREAFERQEWPSAWRQTQRARGVPGYAQSPEALDLSWQILPVLQRDRIEAVWERLALKGEKRNQEPGAISISRDGQLLLVSFGSKLSLYLDTGNENELLWSTDLRSPVICVGLEKASAGSIDNVFAVTRAGQIFRLQMASGVHQASLKVCESPLQSALESFGYVVFLSEEGKVGCYHLPTGESLPMTHAFEPGISRLFPGLAAAPLVLTESQFGVLELQRPKAEIIPFNLDFKEPLPQISYAFRPRANPLLILGFLTGGVQIIDLDKQETVFDVDTSEGAITGFSILPDLSVGVAATDRGYLSFWDLETWQFLEGFSAHKGAIYRQVASTSGRYIVTSGEDRTVRLWETSWTASEERREEIVWLPPKSRLRTLSKLLGLKGKRT